MMRLFWHVAAGFLILGALGWAALLIAALAYGGVAWVSVRRHPRLACKSCGGRGRFHSRLFPWRFRLDAHCGGNGRVLNPRLAYLGNTRQREELRREAAARDGRASSSGNIW